MVDLCWGMEVVVIVEEEEADKSSSPAISLGSSFVNGE